MSKIIKVDETIYYNEPPPEVRPVVKNPRAPKLTDILTWEEIFKGSNDDLFSMESAYKRAKNLKLKPPRFIIDKGESK